MTHIRRGPWWTLPFLYLGAVRNILIPDVGRDVPFVIMNYPCRDPYGRETVTLVRQDQVHRRLRRFDATMINDHGRVIDYLGTHQHLAVDLHLTVLADGSLHIATGANASTRARSGSVSRCSSRSPLTCTRRTTTPPRCTRSG